MVVITTLISLGFFSLKKKKNSKSTLSFFLKGQKFCLALFIWGERKRDCEKKEHTGFSGYTVRVREVGTETLNCN